MDLQRTIMSFFCCSRRREHFSSLWCSIVTLETWASENQLEISCEPHGLVFDFPFQTIALCLWNTFLSFSNDGLPPLRFPGLVVAQLTRMTINYVTFWFISRLLWTLLWTSHVVGALESIGKSRSKRSERMELTRSPTREQFCFLGLYHPSIPWQ